MPARAARRGPGSTGRDSPPAPPPGERQERLLSTRSAIRSRSLECIPGTRIRELAELQVSDPATNDRDPASDDAASPGVTIRM
jgi:hypothetical protein